MAINGIALGSVAVGTLFAYSAVKGKSVLATAQSIVRGQSPATLSNVYPIVGQATSTNTGTGTAQTGTSTGVASPTAYQQYAFSLFSGYGWGTDQEQALVSLWNQESGWNPNAVNPSSGAAGIPQDITGNMHGGWQGQIQWGLSYIKQRYGTPAMAWAHEQANNWY
jgi:hypothetical protein